MVFIIIFFNPDVSVQPYEKCVISGINASRLYAPTTTVFIPGGLQIGVATKGEVLVTLGEPDEIYTSSESSKFTYRTDEIWVYVELWFDENDILESYRVENPTAPENFAFSGATELNIEYEVPSALGNSIEDRIVNFVGDLYMLLAPLSAFFDNGWITDCEDEVVPGDGLLHLELQRENKSLHVTIYNNSEYACLPSDAFVRELSSSDNYGGEFAVSGGITLDLTQEELEQIIVLYHLKMVVFAILRFLAM